MSNGRKTIWDKLAECVSTLNEPFSRQEIVSWFRRHYPDVNEQSLSPHIQFATSNAPERSRRQAWGKTPLVTRIDHGQYRRYRAPGTSSPSQVEPTRSVVAERVEVVLPSTVARPQGIEDRERGFPEKRVQSLVVAFLAREGWTLSSEANTDTRERGIDVVAAKNGLTVGIEVKGYPGTAYADPRRAGEVKASHPSVQAGTYFAQAILTAMRLRASRPEMLSVIAVPDAPRFRALAAEVHGSLTAAGIGVWLIDEDGGVDVIVPVDGQA